MPVSNAAIDSNMDDLQRREEARKAGRPEMTLPGGEILYHGVYDTGGGWWWTTDWPAISAPGSLKLTLSIEVDKEGDHPSTDQLTLVGEVLGNLPDLLAKLRERLPKECLEFDSGGECLESTFRTLQGWIIWFERPSSKEYEWSFLCHVPQGMGRHTYVAKFVGLELVGITPTY